MFAAALSMLAPPAAAADLPSPAHARAYDPAAETVERHRRWRDRDNVDVGDILVGVLILGGIAAIASAAEQSDRQDRYPDYPDYDGAPGYRGPDGHSGYQSQGMDRAVDMCVTEVERGSGRVGSVDGANRTGEGWQVSGELERGGNWSCWIGNDGRVSDIDVTEGYGASSAQGPDGQWSDEAYARARALHGEYRPAQDEEFQ
jgi:hypothetical protein